MGYQFINVKEEMQWLLDVHLTSLDKSYLEGSAIIHGNEDCPEKIEVYPNSNPMNYDPHRTFIYDSEKDQYNEVKE